MRKFRDFPFQFGWQAVFYGLLVALFFLPEFHPKLEFTDLNQLGEATVKREDIAGRITSFYQYLFSFFLAALGTSVASGLAIFSIPENLKVWFRSFAIAGILLCLSGFWMRANIGLALFFAMWQGILFLWTKSLSKQAFPSITILLSAAFSMLIWLNFIWIYPDKASGLLNMLLLSILFGAGLYIFAPFSLDRRAQVMRIGLPAFVLALSPFIVTEIRYGLQVRLGIEASPDFLYLALLSLVGAWVYLKRKSQVSLRKAIYFSAVLLCMGMVLHQFYIPYGEAPQEMYEMANRVLPLMELHFFRTIPLVEKVSSHFVSDYGFGLIYQALFGYHGLDFLIFDVLEALLWAVLVFVVVKSLSKSLLMAFFMAAIFPFSASLFSSYYLPGLIPVLAFLVMLRSNTRTNRWIFALCLVLMIPWRADLSFAYLVAMGAAWIVHFMSTGRASLKWLLPAGITSALFGLMLLLICGMNAIPWTDNLKAILDYLSSSQSYGLVWIGDEKLLLWTLHHLIIPLAAVFTLLVAIHQLRKSRNHQQLEPWIIVLFVSVFVLVNLPRGLVRHGFAEATDNFLLSLGFVALPFVLTTEARKEQRNIIMLFLWMGFSLLLRFPERLPERSGFVASLETPVNARFIGGQHGVTRLTVNPEFYAREIAPLVDWMRTNLKDGETFFDFSNTPMLHYYAEKEVPSLFFQNPQNVHSMTLQMDWRKRFSQWKVPFVIYSHSPRNWWDATDGVRNDVRHVMMALYLRQHYQFHTVVGGYEIWKRKAQYP